MNDGDDNNMRPESDADARLIDQATGDAPGPRDGDGAATAYERAAAALHAGLTPRAAMPAEVSQRLLRAAQEAARSHARPALPFITPPSAGRAGAASRNGVRMGPMLAIAASLAIAGGTTWLAVRATAEQRRVQNELASTQARLSEALERVKSNETLLADARKRTAGLDVQLAGLEHEKIDLAARLATASANLDQASLRIATFDQPADPRMLQANRQKLLEVPDTIRIAWKPFDLPDAPAELAGIEGDVIWNDALKQGYLRFVGLRANDPAVEQYQVWVIDERGMEQKVSGGVFNATAQGEVIVPITPAIDVRKVALFAITIEEPGGTWVPDLKRRVVVAPRQAS